MDEAAFDTAPGNKKNLRVLLVVPPTGDNPWRTRQDYEDDQRRMLSLYRWTMVSVAAACLSAGAAIGALAVSTLIGLTVAPSWGNAAVD